MKNLLTLLSAALVLLLGAGCPNPGGENHQHFSVNDAFTLAQGQMAHDKEDGSFSIQFDKVSADSRCPVGVECIRAGNADVVLTLKKGNESKTVTLTTGDLGEGATMNTSFGGYNIQLTGLEPGTKANQTIEQKDYKAKLLVTK